MKNICYEKINMSDMQIKIPFVFLNSIKVEA